MQSGYISGPSIGARLRQSLAALLTGLTLAACTPSAPETAAAPEADSQTIFLVRHAEKQAGDNPSLTPDGVRRAEVLATLLSDKGITHIHSTDYARTLETAAPIAALTGLDIALYDPRDLEGFASTLRETDGTHLVVGHSNTTPVLSAALGGDTGTPINEQSEYDRLYVITISPENEVTSRIERFGVRYTSAE